MGMRRVSVLGRLVFAYRRLHWSLQRYYFRRARRPLTPEQEAERAIRRLNREQEALRRAGWRR